MIAVMEERDPDHHACAELLESHPGPLLVPVLCLAEVAHLVKGVSGGTLSDVRLLMAAAVGEFSVEQLHPADLVRAAQLVNQYRDLPLGMVDASIIAAAERLEVTTIATLDHRHFSVVRPAHVEAFELVPG